MRTVQRRIDKLERVIEANGNSRSGPSVYLIKSNGCGETYEITLAGQPVNLNSKPARVGAAIIVDGDLARI